MTDDRKNDDETYFDPNMFGGGNNTDDEFNEDDNVGATSADEPGLGEPFMLPPLHDDDYSPPGLPSKMALMIGGAVAVVAIAATSVGVVVAMGSGDDKPATCPGAISSVVDDEMQATPYKLMVDLTSNSPVMIRSIAGQLVDQIDDDLPDGVAPVLLADGGNGTPLLTSTCLDGSRVLHVHRKNDTGQAQALEAAKAALTDHIAEFLSTVQVQTEGSPLRLLAQSATTEGMSVLWTDMLSNAGDCLDPEGHTANTETAEAIVQRCVEQPAIKTTDEPLKIIGAGTSDRSAGFEAWARDLAAITCAEITHNCTID